MSLLVERKSATRESSESRFWRGFKRHATTTLTQTCSSIHFCPVAPFHMAITTSLSVGSNASQKQQKMLSRFNDTATRGGTAMMVAGSRRWRGGRRADIRSSEWHSDAHSQGPFCPGSCRAVGSAECISSLDPTIRLSVC